MTTTADVIPFYMADDFVARLAFSLWSFDRFEGKQPLTDAGSWAINKDQYFVQARYVAEDLDRLGT